jgi:hypothetical protein
VEKSRTHLWNLVVSDIVVDILDLTAPFSPLQEEDTQSDAYKTALKSATEGEWPMYTTKTGAETPRKIASKLQVSCAALVLVNRGEYNGMSRNSKLMKGTVLWLPRQIRPTVSQKGAHARNTFSKPVAQSSGYLASPSRKSDTSLTLLELKDNISPSNADVAVGVDTESCVTYTSTKFDTPLRIAHALGITVASIIRQNTHIDGLKRNTKLEPNTKIWLPKHEKTASVEAIRKRGRIRLKGKFSEEQNPSVTELNTESKSQQSPSSLARMVALNHQEKCKETRSKKQKKKRQKKRKNDDIWQVYTAKDNETPAFISKFLGVDLEKLLETNRSEYKGIKAGSKLLAGTVIWLPKDFSEKIFVDVNPEDVEEEDKVPKGTGDDGSARRKKKASKWLSKSSTADVLSPRSSEKLMESSEGTLSEDDAKIFEHETSASASAAAAKKNAALQKMRETASDTGSKAHMQLLAKFQEILDTLKKHRLKNGCQTAWPFLQPVPLDAFPDYTSVIERPIDLGTISHRIASREHYSNPEDFEADVKLVFQNAFKYNTGPDEGRDVRNMARALFILFEKRMQAVFRSGRK